MAIDLGLSHCILWNIMGAGWTMTEYKRPDMRRSTATVLSATAKHPDLAIVRRVVDVLVSLDAELPIQTALFLLIVAQRPGVYQSEVLALSGMSQSSVSRNVHSLSRHRRDGKPGFGLLEQRLDEWDSRKLRLYLTAEGVAFVGRMMGKEAAPAPALDAFAGAHWEVWVD